MPSQRSSVLNFCPKFLDTPSHYFNSKVETTIADQKATRGMRMWRTTALSGAALAALLVAGSTTAGLAQEATALDEITVTGTRADRPISDVPQSMQVVSRDEIETQLQMSGNPSAALSKLIPGFSVSNQTVSGASETFRGRDLLVMIDGVPLNTPLRDVARIVSLIDLNSVERIEVVAGASSLYGSGATGGTVNFITRKATDGKPTVGISAATRVFTADPAASIRPEVSGSFSAKHPSGFDVFAVASGRFANKTFDGAGRELPSDGMLGQGGGDRMAQGNGLVKFGYDIDPSKRIELSGTWIYLDQQPQWMTNYSLPFARPDFTRPYDGQSVLEDTKSFSARFTDTAFLFGKLSVLAFHNDVQKRFNYSTFDLNYNNAVYYSGALADPTGRFNQTTLLSKRTGVNATIDTPLDRIWAGARLTWGTDFSHDTASQVLTNGQDVFNPMKQNTYAGFAQLQVPIGDRLTVRGGVRYEALDLEVKDFTRPAVFMGFPGIGYAVLPELAVTGGRFSYDAPTFNLGATFKLAERLELYGGFSQGFALPDVGAFTRRAGAMSTAEILHYGCFLGPGPLPPVPYNCPKNLSVSYADIGPKAQIVNNYELGLRGGSGPFRGSLAGFISTSNDGVNFDPATNRISQQKEIIYGVEFTGNLTVTSNLSVGTVLRYQEGRYDSDKDGDIDSYLPNNRIGAPFRAFLHADYRFDNGVVLRVEGEGFSGRDRVINTSGAHFKLEPAAIMNASVTIPWRGSTFFVAANNIFDTAYQNPTATSVRNLPVYSWGRTVAAGFRTTF